MPKRFRTLEQVNGAATSRTPTGRSATHSRRPCARPGCQQSLRTRRLKFAVSSSKGSAGSPSKHRGELRQDFENPAMHDGEVYAWVALGRLPKPYESTTFSLQCIRLRTVRKPEITDARTLSSKPGGRLPTPTCCESAPATQPVNQSSGAQRSTEARASASVSAP